METEVLKLKWNKGVKTSGWNERVYTSVDGRFTITSVMMAVGARSGSWKPLQEAHLLCEG